MDIVKTREEKCEIIMINYVIYLNVVSKFVKFFIIKG